MLRLTIWAGRQGDGTMRLDPIEKPKGFITRMAYWGTRRRFGKVMTPMKVVLARMPGSLRFSNAIAKFELHGIRLEPALHYMVGLLASQINGCEVCMDLGRSRSRSPRDSSLEWPTGGRAAGSGR